MKVIFLKDIPGAKKNQVKEVAKGYALNYLLPNKLAVMATAEKIAALGNISKTEKNNDSKIDGKDKKILNTIKNLKIEMKAKANKDGHLFGGISNEDIHQILKEKHNLNLNKEAIELPHHLKEVGNHKVLVKIADHQAELKVIIKAE
jgi:large subunit ribosomal protein L9